ncbi:MAG: amidohydrolase family protein [Candidatus Hydrogenedentes bacterium]|nr:amidohydrolase family protein [Candidatus Hydrogenedentota bacterium]
MSGVCLAALAAGPWGVARAQESASYLTIPRLVEEKRIVNAHEHIQGEENLEALLSQMDALGIGKTVLVGSPWFTFALYERAGFTRYDENNAALVAMAQAHPDRLEAWPTLNPTDPDKLEKLKALVAEGATGLKLYLGHGYTTRQNTYIFRPVAMDDPGMMPVYAYLAEQHLPVCLHVNPAKPGFLDEFVAVLTRYPDLKVNTPHYFLSSMAHSRLREMLRTFPNMYVDISFGHDDYLKTGLDRVSKNPAGFRALFEEFPDRFIFGTDYVITSLRPQPLAWYRTRTAAYLDMLSRDQYTTELLPGRTLRGLALPAPLLENILYRNYERFRALKPSGTQITRALDWSRLNVRPVTRAPGEALPPPPQASYRRRG